VARFGAMRLVVYRVLAALAASAALAHCTSQGVATAPPPAGRAPLDTKAAWPKFRGDMNQSGASARVSDGSLGRSWVVQTGKGIFSSPVVGGDGTVYIGSADRWFYAIAADGSLGWKVPAEEIIDSAALLDDSGRVYFAAGDGKVRAVDRTSGAVVWTMSADPPSTRNAYINWFEGNVAISPSGELVAPNDGFQIYRIDRATGAVASRIVMRDQTWSSPAFSWATGTMVIGNNDLLGSNLFGYPADGSGTWGAKLGGSVAASPMLSADEKTAVVGSFDGSVYAYDTESGDLRWSFATRDHVYASPARLPDGGIVQASTDGTVYALEPSGELRWQYDTREPIRSSPAIDGAGRIYVGSGDGKLIVLEPSGKRRWSLRLVHADRNDMNASPALGPDAVIVASESGQIFSVPYDYCLRPDQAANADCQVGGDEGLGGAGASLFFTTPFGALTDSLPASIGVADPLVFSLVARSETGTVLATLDASDLLATVAPAVAFDTHVSGDRRFVVLTPKTTWTFDGSDALRVSVKGTSRVDFDRHGLVLTGGKAGPSFAFDATTHATKGSLADAAAATAPAPLAALTSSGAAVWAVNRLALPLPTMLPSYNQIGFDSLHHLVTAVDVGGGRTLGWMIGAMPDAQGNVVADPSTRLFVPMNVRITGASLTFESASAVGVVVMNFTLPMETFRFTAPLVGSTSASAITLALDGTANCSSIPTYGVFLDSLGLCNATTHELVVHGGANLERVMQSAPISAGAIGTVTPVRSGSSLALQFAGATVKAAEHAIGFAVADPSGAIVRADYGPKLTVGTNPDGTLSGLSVDFQSVTIPSGSRALVFVDTSLAGTTLVP
jgi:outer membrane protein assembly factor BamB